MTLEPTPWHPFLSAPTFAFTADQEWAPEWAIEHFLAWSSAQNLPVHVFRTHPSRSLDTAVAARAVRQGWHPNFTAGSSHGDSAEAVIRYCAEHFPGCSTVRSHRMFEENYTWIRLAEAGVRCDSQGVPLLQSYILPALHWTGIVRLPIYFEDDLILRRTGARHAVEATLRTLFSPGLKIFNVHPLFIAANIPDITWYEDRRAELFGGHSEGPVHNGYGVRTVVEEILAAIGATGGHFVDFEDIHLRAAALFAQDPGASAGLKPL